MHLFVSLLYMVSNDAMWSLSQVISWLTHNGEDELKQHSDLAENLPEIKQQEQNFEKFYFISMVSRRLFF